MPGLWGELGRVPSIAALWSEFNRGVREAQEFGWRQDGIGGHWDIEGYYVPYVSAVPGARDTGVFRDSPTANMFPLGDIDLDKAEFLAGGATEVKAYLPVKHAIAARG